MRSADRHPARRWHGCLRRAGNEGVSDETTLRKTGLKRSRTSRTSRLSRRRGRRRLRERVSRDAASIVNHLLSHAARMLPHCSARRGEQSIRLCAPCARDRFHFGALYYP
jgi:hypothetical protein